MLRLGRLGLKGLLLAGGHGTRLRPLTYTGNKHMLPVANKPMLMYGFDQLRAAGISEIGVVLGPLHEGMREPMGDGSKFGVSIRHISQPDSLGIAQRVLMSEVLLGEDPFIVHVGDNQLEEGMPSAAK